jgi:hypothetical protein
VLLVLQPSAVAELQDVVVVALHFDMAAIATTQLIASGRSKRCAHVVAVCSAALRAPNLYRIGLMLGK